MWFTLKYFKVGSDVVAVGINARYCIWADTARCKERGWKYLAMYQPLQKQILGHSEPLAELCQYCARKGKL